MIQLEKITLKEANLLSFIGEDTKTIATHQALLNNEYKNIHREYAQLSDDSQEALKRGLFMIWYSVVEPANLTGLNELDDSSQEKIVESFEIHLDKNNIDSELQSMLAYYKNWEYVFKPFRCFNKFYNYLSALPEADSRFDKSSMINRGIMGAYWNSLNPL